MFKTRICNLLGIEYPILLGGMTLVSDARLAAAVSNGGGLGIIGAGAAPASSLKQEIQKARELTNRPIGVNVVLLSPYLGEVMDLVVEEKVNVVTTGAGNPAPYISKLKGAGIKVIPVIASVALAKRLERAGVDALIAEGMESGGHIGEVTTLCLVPQVVDAVKIPVIAAGGIADGRGFAAALALGAEGIQMGTRFVCATECSAHDNYKMAIIKAKDRDTVVTGGRTGHPVRCIGNRLSRAFLELDEKNAPFEEYEKLGVGKLRQAVVEGDIVDGSVMAGQSSGLVNDIRPAAEIISWIVKEAHQVLQGLRRMEEI